MVSTISGVGAVHLTLCLLILWRIPLDSANDHVREIAGSGEMTIKDSDGDAIVTVDTRRTLTLSYIAATTLTGTTNTLVITPPITPPGGWATISADSRNPFNRSSSSKG